MARLLKIILSIFAAIFLIVIIAATALPFFIDPNDFKPEIQTAVKESTGRELVIDGNLELSVFPWIGISTGKLSLSNAKGFPDKSFAEIAESDVKVKLLPLLSKKIEISRIVLKGLVLNLAKNKQGENNWDDLSASEETENQDNSDDTSDKKTSEQDISKQENASLLAAFAIGGISIEQASISWDDQQQGKYTQINDFNLKTDKLVFDQPIAIDLSLTVVNKDPELTESINFSTDLVINKQLNSFKLEKLKLISVTTGKDIPGEKLTATLLAEVALDLAQQTLDISGLKLNTANMILSADIIGTNISDSPTFKGPINIAEFNLMQLMSELAIPVSEMQDSTALSKVSLDFDILATSDSADFQNLQLKLDDTNMNGSVNIKNFSAPKIDFNLKLDTIDMDRYMASETKVSVSKDKTNESTKETDKAVVTPAVVAAVSTSLFPVETLRELNANGQLTIDILKINNLSMQGIIIKLNAINGLIKTQQTVKHLYQGSYSGNTTINVQNKTPSLALNEKLSKVQLEPLLKDFLGEARMTGVLNAKARVQGRGNTEAALKSTLNGNIDFQFEDGVIRGFNLQKMIDNGKALIDGKPLPTENKNDQTVFSRITGTAQIKNGLVKNNDLYAEASKLDVKGKGTANLVSEKLDYTVTAKLLKRKATETEAEKIKGIPIVIDIAGTFSEPTYKLNLALMLVGKNKEKFNKKKDKLLEKVDKKLGKDVGDLLRGLF